MRLMGRIPAFADGGFRRHGMPTMVSEKGPELLYPGQGGDMVVPLGIAAADAAPPPPVGSAGENKTIDSVALGEFLKAFSSQQLWILGDQVARARESRSPKNCYWPASMTLSWILSSRRTPPQDEGRETLEEWLTTDEAEGLRR